MVLLLLPSLVPPAAAADCLAAGPAAHPAALLAATKLERPAAGAGAGTAHGWAQCLAHLAAVRKPAMPLLAAAAQTAARPAAAAATAAAPHSLPQQAPAVSEARQPRGPTAVPAALPLPLVAGRTLPPGTSPCPPVPPPSPACALALAGPPPCTRQPPQGKKQARANLSFSSDQWGPITAILTASNQDMHGDRGGRPRKVAGDGLPASTCLAAAASCSASWTR